MEGFQVLDRMQAWVQSGHEWASPALEIIAEGVWPLCDLLKHATDDTLLCLLADL